MTNWKSLSTLILLSVFATTSFAQVPDTLGFLGTLTNLSGVPVDSAGMSMTFKLYKANSEIWSETQSVDVVDGLFNVSLGALTRLDTVAFGEPIELGIQIDGDPPELTPRTRLASSPYALGMRGLHAVWAESGVSSAFNIVGGHWVNTVSPGVVGATIGGGGGDIGGGPEGNTVTGNLGTVSGGISNSAGVIAAVGGGSENIASGLQSTVAGGYFNRAYQQSTTVGGGSSNTSDATYATIGGGFSNDATAASSTIAGGYENDADGEYSTIAGGRNNATFGDYSTVAGGRSNEANQGYSLAAGFRAKADHSGSFVWADSASVSGVDFASTGTNQFLVRARGGVGIGTDAPLGALAIGANVDSLGPMITLYGDAAESKVEAGRIRFLETDGSNYGGFYIHHDRTTNSLYVGGHNTSDLLTANDFPLISIERFGGEVGFNRASSDHPIQVGTDGTNGNAAHLTASGVWTSTSSRERKSGFEEVDGRQLLAALERLPVTKWHYKGAEDEAHIGPVAEEFKAAFGLGGDERFIGSVDADGVALAAIKALYELVQVQQERIDALEALLGKLD